MFVKISIALIMACYGVATCKPIANPVDQNALEKRDTYVGEATVYTVSSGAEGSCQTSLNDNEYFVALSDSFMQFESPGPYCGQTIMVTNTGPNGDGGVGGEGNTIQVAVQDTCSGCSEGHIDLSLAAWDALTDSPGDLSHVGISWYFVS